MSTFDIWPARKRFGRDAKRKLTDAEAKQVLATAVSPLVAVADKADVVGIGKCLDAVTRKPCEFSADCLRAAVKQQPMSCRVRIDANAERAEQEQYAVAAAILAQQMLAVIQSATEPITFLDVCAKLEINTGDKANYDYARGAFQRLVLEQPRRIESVGLLRQYNGRNSRKIKMWVAVEAERINA